MSAAIARRSRRLDSPLVVQGRVLWALMLRDVRTRFLGHGLGYLIAIAWPLAHIAILLAAYAFAGRVAPLGNSLMVFFATALIPVISFMYMSRFIMNAALSNRPLIGFPVVKVTDLFLARALLELLASCCMTLTILAVLYCSGLNVVPADPINAMFALAASWLLGLGFGVLAGMIAMAVPAFPLIYVLIVIVFYLTSGVLFMPDSLPTMAKYVVSFNPILHGVEWMRMAFFQGYRSDVIDKTYIIGCGLGALCLGLGVERLVRGALVK